MDKRFGFGMYYGKKVSEVSLGFEEDFIGS